MIYNFSQNTLDERPIAQTEESSNPISYFPYRVEIEGVKTYHINGFNCPLRQAKYTVTRSGMGKANFDFAIMDAPIVSRDKINIYRNGKIVYQGLVDGIPDKAGGKVTTSPFLNELQNKTYNFNYSTGATYEEILEDIILEKDQDTGVFWNATLVDTGSTFVFTGEYKYDSVKKIIKDIQDQLENRYLGIDHNNFFYVKAFSTTVTTTLYADDNSGYEGVKVTVDDKAVKATRSQVYQESTTAGQKVRLGSVGYSTSSTDYPTLAIENQVGVIENKETVYKGLSSSDGLNFAYQKLVKDAVIKTKIDIKNVDYDRYPLEIGERIKIYKEEDLLWHTIIDCESTANWTAGDLSTIAKVGTYSMNFTSTYIDYNYAEYKRWKGIERLGFYIRSDKVGSFVNVYLGDSTGEQAAIGGLGLGALGVGALSEGDTSATLTTTNIEIGSSVFYSVDIKGVNQWQWVDIPTTYDNFSIIRFESNDTSADVRVDEIQLYSLFRQSYEANVIQMDFDLSSSYVNVKAGEFQEFADDDFNILKNEVEALKATQEI